VPATAVRPSGRSNTRAKRATGDRRSRIIGIPAMDGNTAVGGTISVVTLLV
jgi:hypothetical protein